VHNVNAEHHMLLFRGHPLWWHNGGIDGFYALLSLLPDQNLGVVILTNLLDDDPVPEIVQYHIYDHLLGLDSVDWAKHFQELETKRKTAEEEENKKELSERKPNTHPSHELKDYVTKIPATVSSRSSYRAMVLAPVSISCRFRCVTMNTTFSKLPPTPRGLSISASCGF
jgi:hypothetical protein